MLCVNFKLEQSPCTARRAIHVREMSKEHIMGLFFYRTQSFILGEFFYFLLFLCISTENCELFAYLLQEKCVEIFAMRTELGEWNNRDCDSKRGFVCEVFKGTYNLIWNNLILNNLINNLMYVKNCFI